MKWIVGLGNPGTQYAYTRHNIGFMAIDRFADKHGISVKKKQAKAEVGEGNVGGEKVYLIKPQTYMNLSGESVRAFMDFYKASRDDLIVVYDDLDTETGKIRLRYKGGPGGHNGIRSIIQHLGTEEFNRIRIGVSRPPAGREVASYVLSDFPKAEASLVDQSLEAACEALEHALKHPFDNTMGKYNG